MRMGRGLWDCAILGTLPLHAVSVVQEIIGFLRLPRYGQTRTPGLGLFEYLDVFGI